MIPSKKSVHDSQQKKGVHDSQQERVRDSQQERVRDSQQQQKLELMFHTITLVDLVAHEPQLIAIKTVMDDACKQLHDSTQLYSMATYLRVSPFSARFWLLCTISMCKYFGF